MAEKNNLQELFLHELQKVTNLAKNLLQTIAINITCLLIPAGLLVGEMGVK